MDRYIIWCAVAPMVVVFSVVAPGGAAERTVTRGTEEKLEGIHGGSLLSTIVRGDNQQTGETTPGTCRVNTEPGSVTVVLDSYTMRGSFNCGLEESPQL